MISLQSMVNGEVAAWGAQHIQPKTVTRVIGRQRTRLVAAGTFPTVVEHLRRIRRAA